ncbi:MAG: hypothetical protein DRI89_03570 [Bacteroidetes bacterium]|nr:MAG: hypothetical protein DRI89_03570 [Bacteroidota bacterium]
MENQVSSNWYMVLIKGIIMILLAILILSSPGGALIALGLWIGIGLFITGGVEIYRGFALRAVNPNWGWTVFGGVLDLFLGYILMANPLVTAEVLPFVFGFWAAFYGIYLIIDAFSADGNKGMKIISGILILLFANIIMFNPLFAGMTLALWVGIMILVAGIYNVIFSFSLK